MTKVRRSLSADEFGLFCRSMNVAGPAIRSNALVQTLRAAEAAWQRREYPRAIEILERASRLAPNDPRILFDLGRCHGLCYAYEAAEQCFEKAIRIAGWQVEAYLEAGRRCMTFSQPELAQKYFERVLKQKNDSSEALAELSKIHLRHNRLEEATVLADRTLHLNPDFAPGMLQRAILHRLAGELTEAENLLRRLGTVPDASPWTRSRASYELGTILDLQGRYDDAMAAFLQAKELIRPLTVPNVAAARSSELELEKTARMISPDTFRRWRETAPASPSPNRLAVLCGYARSGTTLMEKVLDAHPGIHSLEETSMFYDEAFLTLGPGISRSAYLPGLDSVSSARLEKSRADFFRCAGRYLRKEIDGSMLIDKNPSLTTLIPAVIRIFPDAKFLVPLRDPRDVCISCFTQPMMPATPEGSVFLTLEMTVAAYASVMGFWQTLKPSMPNPSLEVRYEDIVEDLGSTARKMLEFLEVPWDDRVLEFQKVGRNKLVRSPTYADVRKPVTKRAVGRWRNYQKYLEPHLSALDPYLKAFGYD